MGACGDEVGKVDSGQEAGVGVTKPPDAATDVVFSQVLPQQGTGRTFATEDDLRESPAPQVSHRRQRYLFFTAT